MGVAYFTQNVRKVIKVIDNSPKLTLKINAGEEIFTFYDSALLIIDTVAQEMLPKNTKISPNGTCKPSVLVFSKFF